MVTIFFVDFNLKFTYFENGYQFPEKDDAFIFVVGTILL